MRVIGYARVSTKEQDLSSQLDVLKKAGCEKIYEEVASGGKARRPVLEECLAFLDEGDIFVVHRLDRLGRSLRHLVDVVNRLQERGVQFKTLDGLTIDTTTATGQLIFYIFAALAEFERSLIRERTLAGLEAARARGRRGGRQPVGPEDQRVQRCKQLYDAKIPLREICAMLQISQTTIYRWVRIAEEAAEGSPEP